MWFLKFADKYISSVEVMPHLRCFEKQTKPAQSDLLKFGLQVTDLMMTNQHEVDAIIAFGPERYDAVFTLAERFLIPVVYVNPREMTEKEIEIEITNLPIYPYFTPFITIYFTDVITAIEGMAKELLPRG